MHAGKKFEIQLKLTRWNIWIAMQKLDNFFFVGVRIVYLLANINLSVVEKKSKRSKKKRERIKIKTNRKIVFTKCFKMAEMVH